MPGYFRLIKNKSFHFSDNIFVCFFKKENSVKVSIYLNGGKNEK